MRRKENSSLRVILVMTLAMLVFAGIITLIGRLTDRSAAAEIEYEPERRQLKSEEIAADPVSGLSGLMFSSENVMRTDGAYFRLTEDDETGIDSFLQSLAMKRIAFQHENEVRLIRYYKFNNTEAFIEILQWYIITKSQ